MAIRRCGVAIPSTSLHSRRDFAKMSKGLRPMGRSGDPQLPEFLGIYEQCLPAGPRKTQVCACQDLGRRLT